MHLKGVFLNDVRAGALQSGIHLFQYRLLWESYFGLRKPLFAGADLGGGCRGRAPPPPKITCGFLIQLVFCKKKTIWFIGVEVGQETCAPPPKKNLGSGPGLVVTQAKHFTVFCVSVTKSQSNFY